MDDESLINKKLWYFQRNIEITLDYVFTPMFSLCLVELLRLLLYYISIAMHFFKFLLEIHHFPRCVGSEIPTKF